MRPVFKAAQLEANKSIRKAMYLGFLEHEKTVTTMLDKIADSIFSMLFDMIASREATWTKARLLVENWDKTSDVLDDLLSEQSRSTQITEKSLSVGDVLNGRKRINGFDWKGQPGWTCQPDRP